MHERRDDATIEVVAQRDRAETTMTETLDDDDNAGKDVGNEDGGDDGNDGDNDDDSGNANGGSSDNGDNQDSGNDDEMTTMRPRRRR